MMQYESLIFDIDGTLWDARTLSAQAWNQQLKKEGAERYSITPERFCGLLGKTTREIADEVFPDISDSQERYERMVRCMEAENGYLASQPCQVGYPGVAGTLARLAEKHRLFIVSNCDKGYPDICMDKLGLRPYIQDYLCYGDTQVCKAQTIRILMERNGIENAVYIGDTQGDREAAQGAGIPFIWASYGFGTPEDYAYKIEDIRQLLEL